MAQNYKLKKGVLLQTFGDASKTVTNDSPHFTDELAKWYLEHQPGVAKYFEVIPGVPVVNVVIPSRVSAPPIIIIPPERVPEKAIIEPVKVADIVQPKVKRVGKQKK